MSEVLNTYFSMHMLLTLSCLILWAFRGKFFKLDEASLLKLAYLLVAVSVLTPLIVGLSPSENPFGPMVKVWSEDGGAGTSSVANGAINVRWPKINAVDSSGWVFSWQLSLMVMALVAGVIVWKLMRFVSNFMNLNKVLGQSFLFKKIGRVTVWFNDTVETPFSFFNGRAHVVLPFTVLEDRQRLILALSHEIQHHRQRDTLWVYFIEFGKIIFAINPLFNRLVVQILELQELACDEVLIGRENFSPQQYGKCLLDFAENQLSKSHIPAGAVGMAAETHFLTRRVEKMFHQKRVTTKWALGWVLSVSLVTISGTAWALKGTVGDHRITLAQAESLARKSMINQEIRIVVDGNVLYWLNKAVGTEASRKYMREALQRKEKYESMIVGKLSEASFPKELLAVPLIESGFKNNAVSSLKAAGIWQFMPQTARRCGLKVNSRVDERFNPVLLTEAAVCYYQKLFGIFQNWHVALLAYYTGENRMMKVIGEVGHNDVFKLGRQGHLGRSEKSYLPKLMAAMIILRNPELVR